MAFFKNTIGSGVEKNRADRATFGRYWELFFNKFGTFFKINLVYFLFCIPIVTFGPATAALAAMMRNIYLERYQYIFSDFKQYFKENFKKSFGIGIINVIMIELAVFVFGFWDKTVGDGYSGVRIALIAADILLLLVSFYIYPQIAAMDLPLGAIIKNSVILIFLNPLREIIALVLFVSYALLLLNFTIFTAPLLPLFPLAILAFTAVYCCYPAIQKVIIDPYYERTGEHNPEKWETDEDAIFEDMGGKETPIILEKPGKSAKSGKSDRNVKIIK